ncbi:MAG: DNA polymerase III subunit alpha, partial [Candidatus Falkowbacteria bacterium]|nr:DNA polymerase III subunit alpha [Candidatus Falkowbacteria bacterium]
HLHVHTHYSLLDGLTNIDELIKTVKEDEAPAVAITDHGVMYGVIEFYQKCLKAEIKPIIGVEAYLANGSRFDKLTIDDEKKNYHLLLLAANNQGYKNLIKLTSLAHLEGFYYKPRIDWELLEKYHEGLIACTACLAGEIPILIKAGKNEQAKKRILEYNNLFGPGNFYLEIQRHTSVPEQEMVNKKLIEFSRELKVPLVATNDVHYLKKEDNEAQDILLCLQNKKKKDDTDRMNMMEFDCSVRSAKEIVAAFADVPEAVENTLKIAERCQLTIELGNIQLPHFTVPDGTDNNTYLRKLCEEGLLTRYGKTYGEIGQEIKERMDYELSVIEKMDFSSYFLIVADFVNWAKQEGIVVGPGRGSAAGSLVCFLTNITNLDPLKYELLFERFLNPDRISMPDIDMDFADIRRDEVIQYCERKYGKDHVVQIITFGTMAARVAVRDVGRVLNYPYEYCDKLAKMIPMFAKFDAALANSEELREKYKNEEAARIIIDYAKRLEGVARHSSTHACGVLITKNPVTDYAPVQYASSSDKIIVSQYSLHPVEDLGLLKIDFLGLKNLTIIEAAIKIIKNTRGLEIEIDKIPLVDTPTYKLFQEAETTGVFQFESSGMKRYLRELKPTEFEDIIAMVALYRPGPMEWIPDYIAGKHSRKKPTYLHPKLEPILAKTYGVAIYQEQVMQIARALAGFTIAEADVLRKAVGKKIAKLLTEQKKKFIEGCMRNGISTELAEKIFSFIEPFAGYGFNRSHAACYALIGYQTAYLKAHWPAEFMAALLTSNQHDIDRVAIEIEEGQRMGLKVMGPDINQSYESFTVVTSGTARNQVAAVGEKVDTIRFGLRAIKNIGDHIAEVIIKERKQNGPYKSLSDLLERITDKDLNKKSIESLIKSGALDQFGERGILLGNMENILNFNKEMTKTKSNGQTSLFVDVPVFDIGQEIKLKDYPPADRQEKLAWEKELLGLYVTEHPFADYKKQVAPFITPIRDLVKMKSEQQVNVAGIITKIQKIVTRTNKSMLFIKIEDDFNSVEILIFPNLLKETEPVWSAGRAVLIQGRLSDKDQEVKVLANNVITLELKNMDQIVKNLGKNLASPVALTKNAPVQATDLKIIFYKNINEAGLSQLKGIFSQYPGQSSVFFEIKTNGEKQILATDYQVNNNGLLIAELKKKFTGFLGWENIEKLEPNN